MAPIVASSVDQTAELLQKLSAVSQAKPLDIPEPAKKPLVYQYGSVDSGNAGNTQVPSFERSATPLLPDFMDPTMCYIPSDYSSAYYYGGFDTSGNEWDEYSQYVNPDGFDMTNGVYAYNGSLMYHHGYGYAAYVPYSPATSPVPTMGSDGQLYGPQHYQYPPLFQLMTLTGGPFTPNPAALPHGKLVTSSGADQKPLPVETVNSNSNVVANGCSVKGSSGPGAIKPSYPSSFNSNNSYGRGAPTGGVPTSGYQDPRYGFDGFHSPIPWLDGPMYSDGQHSPLTSTGKNSSVSKENGFPSSRNQNFRSNSNYVGLQHPGLMSAMGTHGYVNGMYPNKPYGQYGNTFGSGMGFGSNVYDSRTNGKGWLVDNYRPRGRGNHYFGAGNDIMGSCNELNRGPRAKGPKNQKGATPVLEGAIKGQNTPSDGSKDEEKACVVLDCEQYNREEFPVDYDDAKFFVIKSYSEDDVHKSIKYNVWASTPNGNKKLDAAYHEAQQKSGHCPIFLFFSVNTSGQFVGLSEMVGPVDFQKNVDVWQQDKWTGCFPVKWHIIKDVPNNSLKHITLENNENKPVTNSRDTQEIKLEQGLKLLKIFKEYSIKTCILDDFEFYEVRQKAIKEKNAKLQLQKQVWEGKAAADEKEPSLTAALPESEYSRNVGC
ncbi:YTH domain-containing protein ECT4-like isoform X2 [Hibiscus syriacus]|uniref:YTH domain-containing protein ECT4-like isoform X2 n=1 Tax=Hibiscus syriacus TaxID=106335 RepID=UPI0019250406|nr:YTH domain-containing protein ECT4-like isoform X2 [Hibiscus syriacus]